MKTKKNIIIGVASTVVLVALITIIAFGFNSKENRMEKKLTQLATEFYEGEPKTYASDIITQLGYFMVNLSDMKNMDMDISLFERNSCDMADTYAKLTFKEDKSYDVEVHLNCEK